MEDGIWELGGIAEINGHGWSCFFFQLDGRFDLATAENLVEVFHDWKQ